MLVRIPAAEFDDLALDRLRLIVGDDGEGLQGRPGQLGVGDDAAHEWEVLVLDEELPQGRLVEELQRGVAADVVLLELLQGRPDGALVLADDCGELLLLHGLAAAEQQGLDLVLHAHAFTSICTWSRP